MTSISALVFRRKFGKILDRVVKKHEDIIISRGNKPLVVITPYDHYAPIKEKEERSKRIGEAMERLKEWRERNAEALKGGIDGVDSATFIRRMRDSRYGKPI